MSFVAWTNDEVDVGMLSGVVDINPGSRGFDSTIVKKCLAVKNAEEGWHIDLLTDAWGAAATAAWRYQFSATRSNQPYNSTAFLLLFSNQTDGRDLFGIRGAPGNFAFYNGYQLNYWSGTAWVAVGPIFLLPNVYHVITVTGLIGDAGGVIRVDVGGVMMAQLVGDTKFTASTTIDRIKHYGPGSSNGDTWQYVAEMIYCNDSTSMTYGLRVADLALTAAGTNGTQASGLVTDVNDVPASTATAMAFNAAGQKFTGIATDLPASMATSPILGVRLSALLRRGSTGPQTWLPAVHLATGGYQTGPARTINGIGYTPVAYPFFVNPFTGVPWTYAEVNGMEYGGEAAA